MTGQIENIRKVRAFLLEGIKDLTTEQLNRIPEGFNNNIIWNLGHMVAAQQGICYKRAGITPHISDEFWEQFRSGTKPERLLSESEIANIKQLLSTTMDELEADYNNDIFTGYTAWNTRYNVEIKNIDDALHFVPFHEGLHSGTIGALKRLVSMA
ncbi:DinB family protein [Mucilaginibacter ginsenosidivorans]|uniref:DinB family protein n=1 Tax=Mucilaginibacter ginsenosidivorans TaxID=398053 RepID=A0A5B8V2R9_9SPHI|nr:DinB family protein [Mucilaginibacter ginsenosidivorans]QEC65449.1 DinB family protein [Mucilaginibacter ginsenosidivorans]